MINTGPLVANEKHEKEKRLVPLFPYVGSKKQLLPILHKNLPTSFERYFEIFSGSLCLGLSLNISEPVFTDINFDLMNCYQQIKENPEELIKDLKWHINEESYFYCVRNSDPNKLSLKQQASRIIYLYNSCYRGLIRKNSKDKFNSPFGFRKTSRFRDFENIFALSKYFNKFNVKLDCCGFLESLQAPIKDDFVYLDPPYWECFSEYTSEGFTYENQNELACAVHDIHKRGVKFLLSNSNTPLIHKLYKKFDIQIISANRKINSNTSKPGKSDCEVIIKNY